MNYGPASKYYDLFASKDDLDFYRELAEKHGRVALELGIGTGRVAFELARRGINVWGVDKSKYMLDVARQKLKKEEPSVRKRVKLKLGDMQGFKLNRKFPYIYVPSSTFEHCISQEQQRKCLTNVYKLLHEKGVLAFDISQPIPNEPLSSWWIDRKQVGREEVVRTIFSRRNPETNIVSVNLFFEVYQNGKLKERYHEYGEARVSLKNEIENLLKNVGFRIENVYGDFDKSPYNAKSRKAIFIASKP